MKPLPRLHKAVIAATANAMTTTTSLRDAHHDACEDNPILAILLLDLIDVASRIEHRLKEVEALQKEARGKFFGIFYGESPEIIGVGRTERAAWADAQRRCDRTGDGVVVDSEEHAVEEITEQEYRDARAS